MPKLTLQIDKALLKAAKVYAAQHDTSINELVRQHLSALTQGPSDKIRTQLSAVKPRIEAAAKKHGLRNLRVFGSVARGEASKTSDIDLLVDAVPGTSLFDIAGFQNEVEKVLGRNVDVITPEDLSPRIRDSALADAVPL
jgi:predicted nucleotidyltransferase